MQLVYAILVPYTVHVQGRIANFATNEWMILISLSIALLNCEFNHSRKCLEVLIRKNFDSQNIWRIQYYWNYWVWDKTAAHPNIFGNLGILRVIHDYTANSCPFAVCLGCKGYTIAIFTTIFLSTNNIDLVCFMWHNFDSWRIFSYMQFCKGSI